MVRGGRARRGSGGRESAWGRGTERRAKLLSEFPITRTGSRRVSPVLPDRIPPAATPYPPQVPRLLLVGDVREERLLEVGVDPRGSARRVEIHGPVAQGLDHAGIVPHEALDHVFGHHMGVVRDKGGRLVHTAQTHRLFDVDEELPDRELLVPFALIRGLPASCRDHAQEAFCRGGRFPLSRMPAPERAPRLPTASRGRACCARRGVMQHDHVVTRQRLLLAWNVDEEVGIGLLQVVKRDAVEVSDGHDQPAVHARLLERRMAKENQDRNGR